MKHTRRWALLMITAALLCLPAAAARSQAAQPTIVVVHTATEEQADSLGLEVYFSLRDADGNAILKSSPGELGRIDQEGAIQLLGASGLPSPAQISDPQTPIKIALLIDVSGSMRSVIGEVRAAARKAIESAPPNSLIGVYQFDQVDITTPLNPVQPFTSERNLVYQAIDAINPKPGAPTCLYNAAYQASEALYAAAERPQERRAIILFTDGRDETRGGGLCSQRTADNVITNARFRSTPIYTIGLCETAACANTDPAVLRRMANETAAFSALGQRDQLDNLFGTIMETLNSQWVARAKVYARQGENQAVLIIGQGQRQLSSTFGFASPRDYTAPPSITMTPSYNRDDDLYTITLQMQNTAALREVAVDIWDAQGGTKLSTQTISSPGISATLTLGAGEFAFGGDYCFRARALTQAGSEVKNDEGNSTLAEQCITYEPKFEFRIVSVDQNWDAGKLLINLSLRGAGKRRLLFEGEIVNKAGQSIRDIPSTAPNENGSLLLDLPEQLRQADERDVFTVQLRNQDSGQLIEQNLGFSVTPPQQPSAWPAVLLGLLFVVALTGTAAVVVRNRRAQPQPIATPKPLTPHTTILSAGPRLHLRVTQTRDHSQRHELLLTSFPCIVGRSSNQLDIKGDDGISRQHIQISTQGQDFLIADLNSANGTFLTDLNSANGREVQLRSKEEVRLPRSARVRLGPYTIIELRVA